MRKMIYEEYKVASKRHLHSCNYNIKFLSTITDVIERKNIIENVYYLSGYIIECIVNYAIYDLVGYDKTKSVYKLKNDNSCGLYFSTHISKHKFQSNIEYLRQNGGAEVPKIPIIGFAVNAKMQDLFNNWKSQVRYVCPDSLNENDVLDYVKIAEEIHIKIRLYITKN